MTTLSVKLDTVDNNLFNAICNSIGLTRSAAINAFVKATIRENGIPFELKANSKTEDPYIYSEENMKYLHESIEQLKAGKGKIHELIDID